MLAQKLHDLIQQNLKTYTMILALAMIWLLFKVMTDWIFFSPRNMSNLFIQMTIVSFLSIGMVMIIVTDNMDLSVGSAVGLVSAITAYLQAIILPQLFAGYVAAGITNGGVNYELEAIAACVIGGTGLIGGEGKIFKVLVGFLDHGRSAQWHECNEHAGILAIYHSWSRVDPGGIC